MLRSRRASVQGVGLSRAQLGGAALDGEGDHNVDRRVLRLPPARRVRRVLLQQRRDVAREEVGHLGLVVPAEAAHQVARDSAARVGVGAFDVPTDVLEGVIFEELLVLLEPAGKG